MHAHKYHHTSAHVQGEGGLWNFFIASALPQHFFFFFFFFFSKQQKKNRDNNK